MTYRRLRLYLMLISLIRLILTKKWSLEQTQLKSLCLSAS